MTSKLTAFLTAAVVGGLASGSVAFAQGNPNPAAGIPPGQTSQNNGTMGGQGSIGHMNRMMDMGQMNRMMNNCNRMMEGMNAHSSGPNNPGPQRG